MLMSAVKFRGEADNSNKLTFPAFLVEDYALILYKTIDTMTRIVVLLIIRLCMCILTSFEELGSR